MWAFGAHFRPKIEIMAMVFSFQIPMRKIMLTESVVVGILGSPLLSGLPSSPGGPSKSFDLCNVFPKKKLGDGQHDDSGLRQLPSNPMF